VAYTTDDFLTVLKQEVMAPAKQSLYSDLAFLRQADKVIRGYFVPLIRKMREEFFILTQYQQFTANQANYDIPHRSIARSLRDLKMIAYDGAVPDPESGTRDLPYISPEDSHIFPEQADSPVGFTIQADKIVMVPAPANDDWGLRIDYPLRPSRLSLVTAAALVTSVTADAVTVTSVPSGFSSPVLVDFVQGKQGHSVYGIDTAILSVNANIIEFATGAVPDGIVAGDYLCLAGTSPIIMLPEDCFPLLVTKTAIRILKTMKDAEGAALLQPDADEEERNLIGILDPRVEGEPKKIVNRFGLLRGRMNRNRFLYRE